jgi:hypothetical protein
MGWSKTDSTIYRCKGTTLKGQPCKCRVAYGEKLCSRCCVRDLLKYRAEQKIEQDKRNAEATERIRAAGGIVR